MFNLSSPELHHPHAVRADGGHDEARIPWPCAGARMKTPILLTGMHRSGGSWVAKMIEGGGGVVHVNEPFNRRHPPGLTPGILHVPPPLAYQHVGPHDEAEHLDRSEER